MTITSNPFETLLPRSKPLPAAIHKRVTRGDHGELIFQAKRLDNDVLIPILTEAYDDYYKSTGSRTIPFFDKYSEGVLVGIKYDFIPFIDTPQNRKELILNEVTRDIYLFPEVESEDKDEQVALHSEYMYYYGVQIGKLYNAWCIVAKNPDFFLPDFLELDKQIQSNKDDLKGPEVFSKLEDLFKDSKYIEPCINILMQIDPPAINKDYHYIGRLKGIITVWHAELERANITKKIHDQNLLAQLLNKRFKGLNIARSTIYSKSSRADEYGEDIRLMIKSIEVS